MWGRSQTRLLASQVAPQASSSERVDFAVAGRRRAISVRCLVAMGVVSARSSTVVNLVKPSSETRCLTQTSSSP